MSVLIRTPPVLVHPPACVRSFVPPALCLFVPPRPSACARSYPPRLPALIVCARVRSGVLVCARVRSCSCGLGLGLVVLVRARVYSRAARASRLGEVGAGGSCGLGRARSRLCSRVLVGPVWVRLVGEVGGCGWWASQT
jgi:hypothetical protein